MDGFRACLFSMCGNLGIDGSGTGVAKYAESAGVSPHVREPGSAWVQMVIDYCDMALGRCY